MENEEFLTANLTSLQKRIGVMVTGLRKEMGYTNAEQFAYDHGLDRGTYRDVEAGEANATLRTLLRIAIIHGLTFKQFIALVEEEPGETASSPKE